MKDIQKRIIILGATSAIAEATARIWATQGAKLVLVGRCQLRLDAISSDLKTRGATEVINFIVDCATEQDQNKLNDMVNILGGLDVLLLAYGKLGEQNSMEENPKEVNDLIQTNFTSAITWCMWTSQILERQRCGVLIAIGSVAGDRGRRSNYIYGACKGGLERFIEGLAHKLSFHNARAVIVKPGFIDTPMTVDFKKGFLWTQPEAVAEVIVKASDYGGPVIYAPSFWRWIMLIIRYLPTIIFNKLSI